MIGLETYRRVYAKINKDALFHNISEIRKKVGDTKITAVIKADGYGHGAAETARVIDPIADYYAVAVMEEAISLRENAIVKPIMILGHTSPLFYKDALKYDIALTVYSQDAAEKLSEEAKDSGKTGKIHIALDTGMSRIGFQINDESVSKIKYISGLPNTEIVGIFSHFATADEKNKDFSALQLKRFDTMCEKLKDAGVYIPLRHICNSAGIMEFPHCYYEMVRAGIILYGLYPSDEVDKSLISLKPALELKSHVVNLKSVPAGTGISYGQTYVTDGERKIATIPVGYADGYPRHLSNKGRVLIRGKAAPITGRVCMDQFMVDVTDIPGVSEMDEVTLIGRDNENEITADEIAKLCDTINYEVVCGIGKRVPRIFV